MKIIQPYGKVYTPDHLANFLAKILVSFLSSQQDRKLKVLDPACGHGSLLSAMARTVADPNNFEFFGIDVDKEATKYVSSHNIGKGINQDAICPSQTIDAKKYWAKRLGEIDIVIANPPWSSDRIYSPEELSRNGYRLDCGQYDAYTLFIELAFKLLRDGGIAAFIVPDSLYTSQDSTLRKFLITQTKILFLARLGEKFFPEVNRSTALLIFQKANPGNNSECTTLRMNDRDRNRIFSNPEAFYSVYEEKARRVNQKWFAKEPNWQFSLDVDYSDVSTLNKISKKGKSLSEFFLYGRGIEISKHGTILTCHNCHKSFSANRHLSNDTKCPFCGEPVAFDGLTSIVSESPKKGYKKMYVGENIQRFQIVGCKYIKPNVEGIKYKKKDLYKGPKLLVRKTGLGIKTAVDESDSYVNQTIHIFRPRQANNDIYFFAGVLSSRTLFYYYTKIYGENEWKSHPYVTKEIIESLPIIPPSDLPSILVNKIAELSKSLSVEYNQQIDMELEHCIFRAYGLDQEDINRITECMNSLPNLGAINMMRFYNV